MIKTAAIPFKDLNLDAAFAAAKHIAQAHNIPSLAFPQGQAEPQGRGEDVVQLAPVSTLPAIPEPEPTRCPTKTLKVALPLSAIADIKRRMIAEDVTQQYILMKALQKGGIPIDDADIIEDGRRDR